MNELAFRTFHGSEIQQIIPQLAELRILVFYDFPYLYEGSLEYEQEYLKIYLSNPASIVYAIFAQDELIGATTGIPLISESVEVKQPFVEKSFNLDEVFYFGESILLKEYRGRGLGNLFFDKREEHAIQSGFKITAFCSVLRAADHPLKPANYHSNEKFWMKRGYVEQNFSCEMSWLDRNESQESIKELQFWLKSWK